VTYTNFLVSIRSQFGHKLNGFNEERPSQILIDEFMRFTHSGMRMAQEQIVNNMLSLEDGESKRKIFAPEVLNSKIKPTTISKVKFFSSHYFASP
jgi:hypothetical protein